VEKLRTLIVDDEALARRGLCLRLHDCPGVEVVDECANGREALAAIARNEPDLVFLDIQMPGIDGFEVISRLQHDNMPAVVFVTAFDQFAIQAFDVHAVDYILKPPDELHIRRALERARRLKRERRSAEDKDRLLAVICDITGQSPRQLEQWLDDGKPGKQSYPDKICIRDHAAVTLVPVEEIDWIDAAGDYMCIHAGTQVHVIRSTMKVLEKLLDPIRFQRVHRSTIINMERVRSVTPRMNGDYHLHMEGGMRLKMSRTYKDTLQILMQPRSTGRNY